MDLGVQLVSSVLNRKQFLDILSCLHLNNNKMRPNDCVDKLFKLRPFLYTVQGQIQKDYPGGGGKL